MPELPEVETTLRGIKPHISRQKITQMVVRNRKLRWPIPQNLEQNLAGQTLLALTRRAKYIIFQCDRGSLVVHLGMSGKLRILTEDTAPKKHDHVDIHFANGKTLRFNDPRRFGAVLWTSENPDSHPLLAHLGPEPLTADFNGATLKNKAKARKCAVKTFIMDNKIVVGVGNIYAAESLFLAGIHPETPAGKISLQQYEKLAEAIKNILQRAIKKGGTTLKDFAQSNGAPGYFSIDLQVYGRHGEPCSRCKSKLKYVKIGQRSTVYCPHCQKK